MHLFDRSFIHSFIDLFMHLFDRPFIHSLVRSFIHSFDRSFIQSLVHLFVRLFIHSLVHSFIYSFIRSFVHSFVHLFVHSFISSFIHSFIITMGLSSTQNFNQITHLFKVIKSYFEVNNHLCEYFFFVSTHFSLHSTVFIILQPGNLHDLIYNKKLKM